MSIISALLLVTLFESNLFARSFIESLLRVDYVPGTSVLMLSLGYALGSIAEFVVGYIYFVRDFSLSHAQLMRLSFESFSAALSVAPRVRDVARLWIERADRHNY